MHVQTLMLRYVPEIEDLVDMMVCYPERRRSRNKLVRDSAVILVVLCCVIWTSTFEPMWDTLFPALFFATAFAAYTLRAVTLSTRWGLRRKARRICSRSPLMLQPHEAEAGPHGVTVRTVGLTVSYDWSMLSKFLESDRQFLLLNGQGEPSVVLPKRGLSDPSLVPVCRGLLTEYLAADLPPGPVRLDT